MIYHFLTTDTIFSIIPFYHQQLLNGINFTDFQNNILSFIRAKANSVFNCNSFKGLKIVTRLCLVLSQSRDHKFKNINFKIVFQLIFSYTSMGTLMEISTFRSFFRLSLPSEIQWYTKSIYVVIYYTSQILSFLSIRLSTILYIYNYIFMIEGK